MVFDLIDDKTKLHAMYGILFLYLDYEDLRQHLCHLLYMLTRREDVANFRIRRLQRLQTSVGSEPEVTALLACYRMHCPHRVAMVVTSTRKHWLPRVDMEWRADILKFQRGILSSATDPNAGITVSERRRGKRARVGDPAVPDLDGSASVASMIAGSVTRDRDLEGSNTVSWQQIRSFEQLAKHIDRVDAPAQVTFSVCSLHSVGFVVFQLLFARCFVQSFVSTHPLFSGFISS